MAPELIGLSFCLVTLVVQAGLIWLAYRWGRYGPPLEIRRRPRVDRRRSSAAPESDDPPVEIYREGHV